MKVLVCFLALCAGALVDALLIQSGIESRIIGGQDTAAGEYPYVVSLEYCVRGTCQHACAGTIISPSWILTAAHCFTDIPAQGSFRVIAGITKLDDTGSNKQTVRVSHAHIPSTFGGGAGPNDIAVFKLVTPLTLNDVVKAIRLVTSGYPPTGIAVLLGWGAIGGSITPIMPNNLQAVSVPVLSYDECVAALDQLLNNEHPFDLNSNICTGPLNGQISSCTGDSGDPLVQDDNLIGLVTWSVTPCATVGAPSTVLTRIYNFRNWITTLVDEALLI